MIKSTYRKLLQARISDLDRRLTLLRMHYPVARGAEKVACVADLQELEHRRGELAARLRQSIEEPDGPAAGARREWRLWVNALTDALSDGLLSVEKHYGAAPETRRAPPQPPQRS